MEAILMSLFKAILEPALEFINGQLLTLSDLVLYADTFMQNQGVAQFSNLTSFITRFGISLVILKFLKKGFDVYVVWSDDPDTDPISVIINCIKALAVALCFPVMYSWIANVISDITTQALDAVINVQSLTWNSYFSTVSLSLFSVILLIIAVILYFVIYVQFLTRGFEILVLRLGMPIACMGLIDNNRGVFAGYLQKIFQAVLSALVQVVLIKISLALMITSNPIWAIAGFVMAIRTPRLLNDIILTANGNGGGNIMMKAYYGVQFGKMVKGLVG